MSETDMMLLLEPKNESLFKKNVFICSDVSS